MEELKQTYAPDQWEISPEKAFQKFKEFITRWQKSYPELKRYCHDRYRFYFTYFKYEREIRGMIYTTNWIERLNRDYKRGINMRGAMPNSQAVILLMGTVARNADIYKYPIYNFIESRLFYRTIYNFTHMRKEGIYTLLETLSNGVPAASPSPKSRSIISSISTKSAARLQSNPFSCPTKKKQSPL